MINITTSDFITRLKPLITYFEFLSGIHFSLVGSSVYQNPEDSNDFDIYLVFDSLDDSYYSKILTILKEICEVLENETNQAWVIETRRGPFKCLKKDKNQIHLLIEESSTLQNISPVNALNWINNGKLLSGINLIEIVDYKGICKQSIKSGIFELYSLINSVNDEYIEYLEWIFAPKKELKLFKKQPLLYSEFDALKQFAVRTGAIIYKTVLNPKYVINNRTEIDDFLNYIIMDHNWNKESTIFFLNHILSNMMSYEQSKAGTTNTLIR
jgi:hypothetical protein